ncbi:hypothetical protein CYY_006112 [Polysphondylium violaceum]|uniref:Uncharacterized protein n=1 Tax=Polysphondylium violaceum TaxID=133409 RepID=A0A8J4PRV0_9MYCE|nr:hypothetical protein CYY_006112 [Polysphondylium violaceum]
MGENLAYIVTKLLGSPEEAECISKFELHDHRPANHFRLILITEKNAWCRNISIELSNGKTFGINVGESYGKDHSKVKWDEMLIDLEGATWLKCYYSKMKVVMTTLKVKELNSSQMEALKTKTMVFYWPNDDSSYFNDASNRPSPGQIGASA